MFPLARPLIGSLALLFFIWTWNEFLLPLVVNINPDSLSAVGATNISLPLVGMFLLFQKRLMAALAEGGMKGQVTRRELVRGGLAELNPRLPAIVTSRPEAQYGLLSSDWKPLVWL